MSYCASTFRINFEKLRGVRGSRDTRLLANLLRANPDEVDDDPDEEDEDEDDEDEDDDDEDDEDDEDEDDEPAMSQALTTIFHMTPEEVSAARGLLARARSGRIRRRKSGTPSR